VAFLEQPDFGKKENLGGHAGRVRLCGGGGEEQKKLKKKRGQWKNGVERARKPNRNQGGGDLSTPKKKKEM